MPITHPFVSVAADSPNEAEWWEEENANATLTEGDAVSLIVAVWSVCSAAARVRLRQSSGAELEVTSDLTTAAWNIVPLENVTLDGTYVQVEFEGDIAVSLPARAKEDRPSALRI